VLARLDQIDGVESSFVNESVTLIRLSLRPDADPGKVAGSVRRVLSVEVEDRGPVQFGGPVAAALPGEQWWDRSRAAESAEPAEPEMSTSVRRVPAVLVALLLGCAVVGLGLLWWRHRRHRRDDPHHPSPRLFQQRQRLGDPYTGLTEVP
jgi:hypothetical protein